MRLVDADKQLEWVDCMAPIHGIGLEPVVAVETVRDLINGAPTIDAIPVEWLKQWRDKLKGMGEYQRECAEDISFVLGLWQKEKEAR